MVLKKATFIFARSAVVIAAIELRREIFGKICRMRGRVNDIVVIGDKPPRIDYVVSQPPRLKVSHVISMLH